MSTPVRNSDTTTSMISVSWAPLSTANTGYSAILSYNLQWDSGTNGALWTNLTGITSTFLLQTFDITSSVIAGTTYQVRVRA